MMMESSICKSWKITEGTIKAVPIPTIPSFACLSIINSDAEREAALVWGIHKFQKTKLNPSGLSQHRDQLSCHLTCLCIGVTINNPKSLIIIIIFFHFTIGLPGHHQCKTTTKYIGLKKETLYIYILENKMFLI